MLIPITIASPTGLFLPLIFAFATGLPVIIFAWLLAYTVGNVGKAYKRLKNFEIWFRRIVAVLFLVVGVYYVVIFFI
jgi:threonine/homoserine/homoserine lactone efflux protein